jgi:hypothetical protein
MPGPIDAKPIANAADRTDAEATNGSMILSLSNEQTK